MKKTFGKNSGNNFSMALVSVYAALSILSHTHLEAAIVIANGNIIEDTVNNVEWYKVSETTGMSWNEMEIKFLDDASEFYGFHHADSAELTELWLQAGLEPGTTNDPTLISEYLLTTGVTEIASGSQLALYDESNIERGHIFGGVGNNTVVSLFEGAITDTGGASHVGHYITRAADTSIPEPSTYFLFATMIFAICAWKWGFSWESVKS